MIEAVAPAKINLFLHVTGKRADGYHLLESLVAFADYGDEITVEAAEDLSLDLAGPFGPETDTGRANLVWKAAELLRRETGTQAGARIRLVKKLPIASGIGGGSSDAATTLKLLNRLWGLDLPPARLAALGLSLGADVPVCLLARPAMMRGIGEQLDETAIYGPNHIILVNCNIKVSTADVFRRLTIPAARDITPFAMDAGGVDLASLRDRARNDLEAPAIALHPPIANVIAELGAIDGCVFSRMSGSGATVFGLFDSGAAAAAGASLLAARHPDWWVVATRLAPER